MKCHWVAELTMLSCSLVECFGHILQSPSSEMPQRQLLHTPEFAHDSRLLLFRSHWDQFYCLAQRGAKAKKCMKFTNHQESRESLIFALSIGFSQLGDHQKLNGTKVKAALTEKFVFKWPRMRSLADRNLVGPIGKGQRDPKLNFTSTSRNRNTCSP